MPNTKFDSKSFNPQAFKYMIQRIPNLKKNELKKCKALVGNPDIREAFSSQNGTAYARIAMRGLLDGAVVSLAVKTTKNAFLQVVAIWLAKYHETNFTITTLEGVVAQFVGIGPPVNVTPTVDVVLGINEE